MDVAKGVDAFQTKPDYKGRLRDPLSVGLDVALGVKTYPVDYAEQMERKIMELDPYKGLEARNIKGKIKSAARKRSAMKNMGKSTDYYDKKIQAYVEQLRGLGAELKGIAQTYSETR